LGEEVLLFDDQWLIQAILLYRFDFFGVFDFCMYFFNKYMKYNKIFSNSFKGVSLLGWLLLDRARSKIRVTTQISALYRS